MNKYLAATIAALTLTLMILQPAQAADAAGKIGYMSGSLIAKRADGTVKIMGPKSEVMPGDLLETAKDSYAQVIMNDGTKMTVRPNSNLKIETYQFTREAPKDDSAVFRLLKGGFRTVSGLIGKRGNPDAYKLKAAAATIGIRGTDFTSRLCANKDCDEATPPPVPPAAPVIPTVGRVMLVQGDMTAKDNNGKLRKLVIGSPVYEGDLLTTGKAAHAVVAFRDEGRVTLQEGTIFHVEKFQYKRPDVQENTALRLLKGGVRVVTGLIGRVKHDNYQFRVATATIGVRGTGFDTWCNGACATGGTNPGATQTAPLDGAGVYVWSGEVAMITPTAMQVVGVGQAAILARDLGKPVALTNIPTSITQNATPRPDSVKVDMEKAFESEAKPAPAPAATPEITPPPAAPGSPATETSPAAPAVPEAGGGAEPGVYVTVHDGKVIMAQDSGKTLDVGKGQTGFASDKVITQLPATPKFMTTDKQVDAKDNGNSARQSTAPAQTGCVVK